MSPGYYEPEGEEREAHDAEGWFHTGDLVSIDAGGHFRITGRKKEIYKNRAGQTIAPQRVENLFRDFDAISQSFLVGDHREYNTLLVWPAYEKQPQLRERTPDELLAIPERHGHLGGGCRIRQLVFLVGVIPRQVLDEEDGLGVIIAASIRRCVGTAQFDSSHSDNRGERAFAFLRRWIWVCKRGRAACWGFLGRMGQPCVQILQWGQDTP